MDWQPNATGRGSTENRLSVDYGDASLNCPKEGLNATDKRM
jgi:hypothetical protein